MKKISITVFLCFFILFFAFGEDLLTYIDDYLQPAPVSEQFSLNTANAEFIAGLDRQPAESLTQSNLYAIEDWAFAYTDLTAVHIPEGVAVIGKGAFANNALSSVLLPLSLRTIDEWAFAHNNISAVVFPENVTAINEYAFWGNRVTDVTLGSFVHLSKEAVDSGLYEVYNKANKAAGRYIKKDGIWLRE
jgi:hypothetical protein